LEYLGRLDQQVKLRGFRIELGEIESVLCRHPAVHQAVAVLASPSVRPPYLIAYVVSHSPTRNSLLPEQLRAYLQTQLPDYMIPTRIVLQDVLPLTPNGKIDRNRLAAIVPETTQVSHTPEAPRTPAEQLLHNIWQQILGMATIGIHDNFFELGGDSILGIQMIAKASQVGLHFSPKQVFQHQTIAALAAVANATPASIASQNLLTGAVPLTPIQYWFFEQNFTEMHHWNQAVLLEVKQPIHQYWLEQAVQELLKHHDSLRLRFYNSETGWQQEYAAAMSSPFSWIDLSHLSEFHQTQSLETIAAALQTSLNLSTAPLRIAFFAQGKHSGRLLLIVHHLLVDGISWRILLNDLQTLYQQLSHDEKMQLPPKTTAFRQWAEVLSSYVPSPQELSYWQSHHLDVPLPVDLVGTNCVADMETVSVSLSVNDTQSLLQEVPSAYQTQINDVLLTALTQTFTVWTGDTALLLELEAHGREDLFAGIDLSRTVGWFTALFPVRLDLSNAETTAAALKAVKEQLRSIPNRGIGYGILRYLQNRDLHRGSQNTAISPQVRFNYLGQIDQVLAESSLFKLAPEAVKNLRSSQSQRGVLLEINAMIRGEQLRLDWSYSRAIHHRSTITALAEQYLAALRHLIQHCLSPDTGGYTPSDFPLMAIDQAELDELLTEL
jgi:non-ribosomal peptide synthase protein (TIGR01720 family)